MSTAVRDANCSRNSRPVFLCPGPGAGRVRTAAGACCTVRHQRLQCPMLTRRPPLSSLRSRSTPCLSRRCAVRARPPPWSGATARAGPRCCRRFVKWTCTRCRGWKRPRPSKAWAPSTPAGKLHPRRSSCTDTRRCASSGTEPHWRGGACWVHRRPVRCWCVPKPAVVSAYVHLNSHVYEPQVAHNAINQALLGAACGWPPVAFRRFEQSNGALTVLSFTPGEDADAPATARVLCVNVSSQGWAKSLQPGAILLVVPPASPETLASNLRALNAAPIPLLHSSSHAARALATSLPEYPPQVRSRRPLGLGACPHIPRWVVPRR